MGVVPARPGSGGKGLGLSAIKLCAKRAENSIPKTQAKVISGKKGNPER